MIRKFEFNPKKYGFELLMDLHRFETNPKLEFVADIHTIDFYEVLFFEYAEGAIEWNGFQKPIAPGTIFFACPHQKKRFFIEEEGIKGFHLVFQQDFLADFFSDKLFIHRLQYFYASHHPQFFDIPSSEYVFIRNALYEIQAEIENFQTDSHHIIRSLLYYVLVKLNRLYAEHYQLSSETQQHTSAYQFKEALELNFHRWHQVHQYAKYLGIDRQKLNSIVKEQYSSTASRLIYSRLLQEIKSRLLYTEQTITEIAIDLNFSEANNLSRFFRREMGVSPSEFRINPPN